MEHKSFIIHVYLPGFCKFVKIWSFCVLSFLFYFEVPVSRVLCFPALPVHGIVSTCVQSPVFKPCLSHSTALVCTGHRWKQSGTGSAGEQRTREPGISK